MTRIVLASQSPRCIALLRQIGLVPEVIPSKIEETMDIALSPSENAMRLAEAKAIEVGGRLGEGIIIGADTIVLLNGEYLGKPVDRSDAIRMLELLSGRTHIVITGFSIVAMPGGRRVSDFEETQVTFRPIPRSEIEAYVASGSPMDKAGSYGIQDDYGAVFVSRVEGCYYNVVGLPLSKLYVKLQEFQTHMNG